MIVCVCKNISESKLKSLLNENTIEKIINTTGLCTKCKTCKETVKRLVLENAMEKDEISSMRV